MSLAEFSCELSCELRAATLLFSDETCVVRELMELLAAISGPSVLK
jgi:hypothetical protein